MSGLLAVVFSFVDDGFLSISVAVITVGLLLGAYAMRLIAEHKYDLAETMRRQSVMSEGLDWQVSSWQMDQWRRRVGRKIRDKAAAYPRDVDYYASKSMLGPKRLAEMVRESAFYTRQMYARLEDWSLKVSLGLAATFVLLLVITATERVPDSWGVVISKAILVAIPAALAVDVFGWVFRLHRLGAQIEEIERGLDHFLESGQVDEVDVMRLVSEYNCQVVTGIPVLPWFWERWHGEIRVLWERRGSRENREG